MQLQTYKTVINKSTYHYLSKSIKRSKKLSIIKGGENIVGKEYTTRTVNYLEQKLHMRDAGEFHAMRRACLC